MGNGLWVCHDPRPIPDQWYVHQPAPHVFFDFGYICSSPAATTSSSAAQPSLPSTIIPSAPTQPLPTSVLQQSTTLFSNSPSSIPTFPNPHSNPQQLTQFSPIPLQPYSQQPYAFYPPPPPPVYPPYNPSSSNAHLGQLPKMLFPQFDADNPKLWLSRARSHFEMYSVHPAIWVRVATHHFTHATAR